MRPIISTRPAHGFRTALLAATCALALGACSSDDDGTPLPDDGTPAPDPTPDPEPTPAPDTERYAFVSGATPVTFDAGQIERLTLGDTIVSSGFTPATGSDIRVATDGSDVYQIGRFRIDTLTRFAPNELDTPVWQYSVNGDEIASNPYQIVFASPTKAYVIRYGSPFVWIVDPTATDESAFKIGEIDLSAYDVDESPNASGGVIVDGKLFVLMERLEEFAPVKNGYVAVIDTATDTELETGGGEDGLPGIALGTRNPSSIAYVEALDEILVVGRGNPFVAFNGLPDDPYTGGLEVIDPESYTREPLIDDGDENANQGFFSDALVVSATKGYLVTYETIDEVGLSTLRTFDPSAGLLADGVVAGLERRDLSALALGPDGRVWVGLNDPEMPGFTLLDPSDDSVVVDLVPTEFNPNDVVFVDAPAAE